MDDDYHPADTAEIPSDFPIEHQPHGSVMGEELHWYIKST